MVLRPQHSDGTLQNQDIRRGLSAEQRQVLDQYNVERNIGGTSYGKRQQLHERLTQHPGLAPHQHIMQRNNPHSANDRGAEQYQSVNTANTVRSPEEEERERQERKRDPNHREFSEMRFNAPAPGAAPVVAPGGGETGFSYAQIAGILGGLGAASAIAYGTANTGPMFGIPAFLHGSETAMLTANWLTNTFGTIGSGLTSISEASQLNAALTWIATIGMPTWNWLPAWFSGAQPLAALGLGSPAVGPVIVGALGGALGLAALGKLKQIFLRSFGVNIEASGFFQHAWEGIKTPFQLAALPFVLGAKLLGYSGGGIFNAAGTVLGAGRDFLKGAAGKAWSAIKFPFELAGHMLKPRSLLTVAGATTAGVVVTGGVFSAPILLPGALIGAGLGAAWVGGEYLLQRAGIISSSGSAAPAPAAH